MSRNGLTALALSVLMVGCDAGSAEPGRDGGFDSSTAPASVTYYEHVRPLLVESCTTCHVEGGVAPFALTTYEAAVEVAERMREVTAERTMPPFLADNSGSCNTWSNHRGLTDAEIATVDAWVRAGTPAGDPTIPAPPPASLPRLASVDATLRMAAPYATDATIDDEYRCFVLETGLTQDMFLTGYDVAPGNVQRVHHVIVYSPASDAAATRARERDAAESERDGYTCYGGAGVDAAPVVLWAPGTGATRFPRGTGIQLRAGRPLVMQVHYNNQVPRDVPATDLTEVQLSLAETASPAFLPMLADLDLALPPRTAEVVESARSAFDRVIPVPSVRVWGIFPHMHTLGRSLRVDINRPDADQCLIDVPRWDFHWQMAYWLSDPIEVTPQDAATITCTFDTRSRDTVTRFGEGTEDEMCLAFVYVTL